MSLPSENVQLHRQLTDPAFEGRDLCSKVGERCRRDLIHCTVRYRYHPIKGKPIPLGRDRQAAIRQVLDLEGSESGFKTLCSGL